MKIGNIDMDRSLAEQHLENQLRLYRQALDEAVVERDAAERKLAAEKERCAKIVEEFSDSGFRHQARHDLAAKIRSGE